MVAIVAALCSVRLQLHQCRLARHRFERFFERRDLRSIRQAERADHAEGQLIDLPGLAAHALECGVVEYNQLAVRGHAHIEFAADAFAGGGFECTQ